MGRRVVITGLGALSPVGVGVHAYWDGLFAGRSGVRRVTLLDPAYHERLCGAEVADFDPLEFLSEGQVSLLGRAAQFSLIAAQMALADARLDPEALPEDRFGIYAGASTPVMDMLEDALTEVHGTDGFCSLNPLAIAGVFPHAHTANAHRALGATAAHGITFSTACTSGTVAMGFAAAEVSAGRVDVALSGAADSTFTRGTYNGLESAGLLYREEREPERIVRPFNVDRDGSVLGEGGAFVILEPLELARARGATILAEWLGSAAVPPEAHSNSAGVQRGLRRAMTLALADAGLPAESVDYVSANAPSDRRADAAEAAALWDVFGARTPRIPVSSIKGMIGNPLGAVGPLQVVAMCGTFARAMIPPTLNVTELDPRCRLDVVANEARRNRVRIGLINVRAMDGSHASVLVGAPPVEAA